MDTHESYVSLETAKLLKQVGFDWECSHWISNDGSLWITDRETNNLSPENKERFLHCPSFAVAQRWLREVKNTHIEVSPNSDMSAYIYNILLSWDKFWICSTTSYDTYEEGQEGGIKKALEIILEKGGQYVS